MTISQADIKRLYNFAGNQCCFPDCTETLVNRSGYFADEIPSITSQIAHIVGQSFDGPRGNYPLPLTERDKYDNLILLCPKHHKIIDDNPDKYTVSLLHDWKLQHKALVTDATKRVVERRKNTIGLEGYLGVYIAYEEIQWSLARLIYRDLKELGYKPFLLPTWQYSQDIAKVNITNNAHFLVLLTNNTIQFLVDQTSKLYQEIGFALNLNRNTVKIIYEDVPDLSFLHQLPIELAKLQKAPSVKLTQTYFGEGIRQLCERFLIRLESVKIYGIEENELIITDRISQEVENATLFQTGDDLDAVSYRLQAHMRYILDDLNGALIDINAAIELDPTNPDGYIDRGLIRFGLNKSDLADADYRKAVELNPNSSRAFNNWGSLYSKQGQHLKALECFDKAMMLNESNIHALLNRSITHLQMGEFNQSIADTTQAIKLDDHFLPAYINRANAYLKKKQTERAIADCLTALDLDPDNAIAHDALGNAYKHARNEEKALDSFARAVELSSEDPIFVFNYATMLAAKRDWINVLTETDKLLKADMDKDIHNLRSLAYYHLGSLDTALEEANLYVKFSPNNPMALSMRGLIFREKGRLSDAVNEFKKAITIDEMYFDGWHELGITLGKMGQYNEAIDNYTKALELRNDNYLPYYNRGGAYLELGNLEKAIDDYNTAIGLETNDSDVFVDRGVAYLGLGKMDRSLQDQTQAIDLNPKDPKPYINRGLIYVEQENLDAALAEFFNAINLEPNNPLGHFNLANVYFHQKRYEKAISSLDKALKIDPKNSLAFLNRSHINIERDRFDLALLDCNRAIEISSNNPNTFIQRGLIHAELGDIGAALDDFNQTLELDPQNVDAFINLTEVYARQQLFEDAIKVCNRAIKATKNIPRLYMRRAVYCDAIGKTNRAIIDVKKVLRMGLEEDVARDIQIWLSELKAKNKK